MTLWCYFAVLLTEPGRVPDGWQPPPDDDDEDVEAADAAEDKKSNSEKRRRFCRKCTQWKPERHHCSVCGRCVLKMDVTACGSTTASGPTITSSSFSSYSTPSSPRCSTPWCYSPTVGFFKDMEAAKQRAPNGGDPARLLAPQGFPHVALGTASQGAGMATRVRHLRPRHRVRGFAPRVHHHARSRVSNMATIEMYEKRCCRGDWTGAVKQPAGDLRHQSLDVAPSRAHRQPAVQVVAHQSRQRG